MKLKTLSLDPSFDERNYGCKSFREFLLRLHHVVHVEQPNTQGRDVQIQLVTPVG